MARKREASEALAFADAAPAARPREDAGRGRAARQRTICVDQDVWTALQIIAIKEGTTRSKIIQDLMEGYVREHGGAL